MQEGIQTFMAEAGEAACYALCIIEIAERVAGKPLNPTEQFYNAVKNKWLYYNFKSKEDNDNFTVLDPARWLSSMTGVKWTVEKTSAGYKPGLGEYAVDRWERKLTGKTIGHFRLPDWDSLVDSQTVKYGEIVSRRLFKRVS